MALPIPEHESRLTAAGEVHARPFEAVAVPLRASHLAIIHCEGCDAATEREHLAELMAPHGAEPPGEGTSHSVRDLGALRMRFERHTEFSTYTFYRFDAFESPFEGAAIDLVPRDWLAGLPGKAIAAIHLAVDRTDRAPEALTALFDGNPLVGSRIAGNSASVWTDFRLHADGWGRILVRDLALTPSQTGRVVQRLFEIETYRLMASMAFPLARRTLAEVGRIERDVTAIVAALADPAVQQNDRDLLDRLTGLAAESERLDASTAYRLSAAQAYYAIVDQRIAELREDRIPGLQMVAEFMDRRLVPAMTTCATAAERQQVLAQRLSRTGDLLRTRVDIALEERNGELLKSMNRRAKLQLKLQETVEGLSVVAISYYLMGLVSYAAKGLKAAGILPFDAELTALAVLPVILGGVALALRRLRRAAVLEG